MPTPQRRKQRFHAVLAGIFSIPFGLLGVLVFWSALGRENILTLIMEFLLGLVLLGAGGFLGWVSHARWPAFRPLASGSILAGAFDFTEHPNFPRLKVKKTAKGRMALPTAVSRTIRRNSLCITGNILVVASILLMLGRLVGGGEFSHVLVVIISVVLLLGGVGLIALSLLEGRKGAKYSGLGLELSHEPIAPGDLFEFHARQPGTRPVERMEVRLVAEEASLWDRTPGSNGSGPAVEKRYRFIYEKLAEAENIPASRSSLVLAGEGVVPAGAMHSLKVANCRIDWYIEVRLLFAEGEDLRELFRFRVAPLGQEEEPQEPEPTEEHHG